MMDSTALSFFAERKRGGQLRQVSRLAETTAATSRAALSRRLPRPLTIPTVMMLRTVADVRTLIDCHMPGGNAQQADVALGLRVLDEAARGADTAKRPHHTAQRAIA
jgi:hypothetical protein